MCTSNLVSDGGKESNDSEICRGEPEVPVDHSQGENTPGTPVLGSLQLGEQGIGQQETTQEQEGVNRRVGIENYLQSPSLKKDLLLNFRLELSFDIH